MSTLATALTEVADAHILIVDDQPANTALLSHLLTRAGIRTITALNDPRDVAATLVEHPPDLVLLDLHMPHLDGYDVLQMITRHAAGRFLPVIVLTADTAPTATHRALDLGAHDFLTKPLDTTEVTLRIRNLLRTRAAYEQLRRSHARLNDQLDLITHTSLETREPAQIWRGRIEGALAAGGPRMVYQPLHDLHDGHIVGHEALARFDELPGVGPDVWFTQAARVGYGVDLETRALRNALTALPVLPADTFVAVNLSPATLLANPADTCPTDTPWDRVVFELTEHTPVEDYDTLTRAFTPLRDLGARLAVDDTGAGYASMRHILKLAPDIIKLDISLTRGIDVDPTRQALAIALIAFTTTTGTTLVAEGIETQTEQDTLTRLGATWGQGYHLSKPQPLPL